MPENNNNNLNKPKQSNNIMDLPRITTPEPEVTPEPPMEFPKEQNPASFFNQPMPETPASAPLSVELKNKPLIEIPDAYYEQLAKEKAAEEAKEAAAIERRVEAQANQKASSKAFLLVILTALITFGSLYLAINQNELFIFAIPVYVILGSIITAIKNKKENGFPVTIMVGGMIVAVFTFVLSMLQEEKMDMWTTYAIAGAIVAFIGMITANIINKLIAERENIKAIQTLGYLLYFVALVAVPYYLYTNYREEFYKFVFQKQTEVRAETEEEFVMKTLKNRYGLTFTCDSQKTKHQINQNKQKMVYRECSDSYNNKFTVTSTAYNEGSNEYIVTDTYIDVLLINNAKKTLSTELLNTSVAEKIDIYLYPEKNCTFVGDCVDCDEYYARYEEETNPDKQYKNSSMLNLEKYLTLSTKEFINEYEFKLVIELTDQYNTLTSDYSMIVDTVLNKLNTLGYKNTSGFIITIYNDLSTSSEELTTVAYKVTGTTNQEKTFKDPIVVK